MNSKKQQYINIYKYYFNQNKIKMDLQNQS